MTKNRKQVAVLGLGRFGSAVALELTRLGHEVLALDQSQKTVQELADDVTHVAQVDITNADALRELGLESVDAAIVAVSSHLEASILATVILRRLGVQRIVAKAADQLHGHILEQVGASRVVYPERETGFRVAHSFAAEGVVDYLDVAPGYGFARISVTEPFAGRSLGDIDLPRAYGVTPMAMHREGTVRLNPDASQVLKRGDDLIVAGLDENLARLPGAAVRPKPD